MSSERKPNNPGFLYAPLQTGVFWGIFTLEFFKSSGVRELKTCLNVAELQRKGCVCKNRVRIVKVDNLHSMLYSMSSSRTCFTESWFERGDLCVHHTTSSVALVLLSPLYMWWVCTSAVFTVIGECICRRGLLPAKLRLIKSLLGHFVEITGRPSLHNTIIVFGVTY